MTWREYLRLFFVCMSPIGFEMELMRLRMEMYNSSLIALVGRPRKDTP